MFWPYLFWQLACSRSLQAQSEKGTRGGAYAACGIVQGLPAAAAVSTSLVIAAYILLLETKKGSARITPDGTPIKTKPIEAGRHMFACLPLPAVFQLVKRTGT